MTKSATAKRFKQAALRKDAVKSEYREAFLDALDAGNTISELSDITGLRENTLRVYKSRLETSTEG